MRITLRNTATAAAPVLVPEPQARELLAQIVTGLSSKYPKLAKRMKGELREFKFEKGHIRSGSRGGLTNDKKGSRGHFDDDRLMLESQSGYGDNNTDKEDRLYFRYMVLESQPDVKGLQISGTAKTVDGLVKVLVKQLDTKSAAMKAVVTQYQNAVKRLNEVI